MLRELSFWCTKLGQKFHDQLPAATPRLYSVGVDEASDIELNFVSKFLYFPGLTINQSLTLEVVGRMSRSIIIGALRILVQLEALWRLGRNPKAKSAYNVYVLEEGDWQFLLDTDHPEEIFSFFERLKSESSSRDSRD